MATELEQVVDVLVRIAGTLERIDGRLDSLQRAAAAAAAEDAGEIACPHCGGLEIADTTCMGDPRPRLTCEGDEGCGRSFDAPAGYTKEETGG